MGDQVDLAHFLFRRLYQLGVRGIHGVPGDYNLTALDYIRPAGLTWVGNANELNSGYAADGYARIKGISAVITAFGVGELSAINAFGGAFAERAPVVHIVGTPPTQAQEKGMCLHHSLGYGNFRMFAEMAAKVTVAQVNLTNPGTAAELIDKVLSECIVQSRPVYIELPVDRVQAKVSASTLETVLEIPTSLGTGEDAIAGLIVDKIHTSKHPAIIVDGFAARWGLGEEIDRFVRMTGFPTFTTPFGKGIVDESLDNFYGLYPGTAEVQSLDFILRLGPLLSDVNTARFSVMPDPEITVSINNNSVQLSPTSGQLSDYERIHVKGLFASMLKRLEKLNLTKTQHQSGPRSRPTIPPSPPSSAQIDQANFWPRVSGIFRADDVILAETGTPSIGSQSFILPPQTTLINSSIWLSIGYMLGACAGAALAQRELSEESGRPRGRTILFEGDGSLQMTVQAISDIIRNRLDVVIFVINNDGYTIERYLHGFEENYNDVQPWNYLEAPSFFGAPTDDLQYPITTRRAANWGQLNDILEDKAIHDGRGLNIVEVLMHKFDAPELLKRLKGQTVSTTVPVLAVNGAGSS